MNKNGSSNIRAAEEKSIRGRLSAVRERYRVQVSTALAILTILAFIAAEVFSEVQDYISSTGLIQYIVLLVLLDLAIVVYAAQQQPPRQFIRNQDESMPRLIEAAAKCRIHGADLLEYAGATTLPLIRAIRRDGVPMRMLVKHPDTITGIQKQRMITTLDTLYNSIFDDYQGAFEIRCYRLPFTLRGRRLGRELLELGWLTPDVRRQTAFGHANPSLLVDLASGGNDYLVEFFERTFNDLWNDSQTEDGRSALETMQAQG